MDNGSLQLFLVIGAIVSTCIESLNCSIIMMDDGKDLINNEKAENPSELEEMEMCYIFFPFISLQVKCPSKLFEKFKAQLRSLF